MPDDAVDSITDVSGPGHNVPQSKEHRDRLGAFVREYVGREKLVAPLSMGELRVHSQRVVQRAGFADKFVDFTAVLLGNETWRSIVARIPYERRLLLLPQCLRSVKNCRAEIDDLGLICDHCGSCVIDELQDQAQSLGYAVLVAEGSPMVMSLIESGKIEAVIGASCLAVLERTFPYMEAGAIPGIAIPLLRDGCVETGMDMDWLWEAIYLNSDQRCGWLNLGDLKDRVRGCFSKDSVSRLLGLGQGDSQVEQIGMEWLAGAGKRWRPILTAGVYDAILPSAGSEVCAELCAAVVAVECFHKASLIHDDIEDDDRQRYGQQTLHRRYGVPIALNVGDYLLGEGYRLLADLDIDDKRKARMLYVAAHGHRRLCIGQGRELAWMRRPGRLTRQEIIEIFRYKTSPAFEVALRLGAILAGCDDEIGQILADYSDALGVAYQIRDDIEDFRRHDSDSDLAAMRAMQAMRAMRQSVLFAIACQRAEGKDATFLEGLWAEDVDLKSVLGDVEKIFEKLSVQAEALALLESYKTKALRCLERLNNSALKTLLRRVVCKIFNDIELLECCDDYKAGHAGRGEQGD